MSDHVNVLLDYIDGHNYESLDTFKHDFQNKPAIVDLFTERSKLREETHTQRVNKDDYMAEFIIPRDTIMDVFVQVDVDVIMPMFKNVADSLGYGDNLWDCISLEATLHESVKCYISKLPGDPDLAETYFLRVMQLYVNSAF